MAYKEEFTDARRALAALGVHGTADTDHSKVFRLLEKAPGASEFLQIRVEIPDLPPDVMGMLVPQTRIFLNVQRAIELRADILVAGIVFSITQNLSASLIASAIRKVQDILALLDDDEDEVVREMFHQAAGSPYRSPVAEEELQKAFAETNVPLEDVLDRLEKKRIIEKSRSGLRLVF